MAADGYQIHQLRRYRSRPQLFPAGLSLGQRRCHVTHLPDGPIESMPLDCSGPSRGGGLSRQHQIGGRRQCRLAPLESPSGFEQLGIRCIALRDSVPHAFLPEQTHRGTELLDGQRSPTGTFVQVREKLPASPCANRSSSRLAMCRWLPSRQLRLAPGAHS